MYKVKITVLDKSTEFDTDDKDRKLIRALAILADKYKNHFSVLVTKMAKPKPVKFKGIGSDVDKIR